MSTPGHRDVGAPVIGIDAAVRTGMLNLALLRSISIGVLGLGLGIAFYGFMASASFAADLAGLFAGRPTGAAIWLLIGGMATLVAGAVSLAATSARLRAVRWSLRPLAARSSVAPPDA